MRIHHTPHDRTECKLYDTLVSLECMCRGKICFRCSLFCSIRFCVYTVHIIRRAQASTPRCVLYCIQLYWTLFDGEHSRELAIRKSREIRDTNGQKTHDKQPVVGKDEHNNVTTQITVRNCRTISGRQGNEIYDAYVHLRCDDATHNTDII